MIKNWELFAVPIGCVNSYDRHDVLKELVSKLVQDRPIDKGAQDSADYSGVRNTFNSVEESLFSIHDISPVDTLELAIFESWCTEKLDEFLRDTLQFYSPSGGIVTDCWVNEALEDDAHQKWHMHSNSILSATYYLNYDPSIHEPLTFISPVWQAGTSPTLELNTTVLNKYNSTSFTPEYHEGAFLIWSSHLKHGYHGNKFNKGRMSISMNYLPKTIKSYIYSFDIVPGR